MSDSLIERMARAICRARDGDPNEMVPRIAPLVQYHNGPEVAPRWESSVTLAISLLRVMREPTDGMRRAAEHAAGDMATGLEAAIFTAMIDAALAEGDTAEAAR